MGEHLDAHGFAKRPHGAYHAEPLGKIAGRCGKNECRQVGGDPFGLREQPETVHNGHLEFGNENIYFPGLEDGDRPLSVGGGDHHKAVSGEAPHQGCADVPVVVG